MNATNPAFAYPPELLAELKAASATAPEGPWRGRENDGDRPLVLDAGGYVVAKLSDDQEGEEAQDFIVRAVNFTRAYLGALPDGAGSEG